MKLHFIVIPFFNVVLISGKDENAINIGKHVYFTYRNSLINLMVTLFIRCKLKFHSSTSFTCICRDFRISGFSRLTICKLITAVTVFWKAFLIKINHKKLDQTISKLLTFAEWTTNFKSRTQEHTPFVF